MLREMEEPLILNLPYEKETIENAMMVITTLQCTPRGITNFMFF